MRLDEIAARPILAKPSSIGCRRRISGRSAPGSLAEIDPDVAPAPRAPDSARRDTVARSNAWPSTSEGSRCSARPARSASRDSSIRSRCRRNRRPGERHAAMRADVAQRGRRRPPRVAPEQHRSRRASCGRACLAAPRPAGPAPRSTRPRATAPPCPPLGSSAVYSPRAMAPLIAAAAAPRLSSRGPASFRGQQSRELSAVNSAVLRIIRHPGSGSSHPRGAVLAMGNFDGLHRGPCGADRRGARPRPRRRRCRGRADLRAASAQRLHAWRASRSG